MQYLTRKQVPVSWALADAYTTCDRWFASVMGPTLPEPRLLAHRARRSASARIRRRTPRSSTTFAAAARSRRSTTALHDKGVDWAYYYGSIPVGVDPARNAGPYQLDLGPNDGTGNIRRFGDVERHDRAVLQGRAAGKLPPVVYIDPVLLRQRRPPADPPDQRPGADRGGLHRAREVAAVEELHARHHVRRARRVLRSRVAADDDRRHAAKYGTTASTSSASACPAMVDRSVRQAGLRQLASVRPHLRAQAPPEHVRRSSRSTCASTRRTTSPTASTWTG